MKLSINWLLEWLKTSNNISDLCYQMTNSGFEVDYVKPVVENFLSKIIIGKILECNINSDGSYFATINVGNNKKVNVISFANNCKKNMKVIVYKYGVNLKKKIINYNKHKKYFSKWHLCSKNDIGLITTSKKNKDEIFELPKNAPIGENANNYLMLNDYIIKVNIPYNRPDCLNIFGIAKDLTILNKKNKFIKKKINIKKNTTNFVCPIKIKINKESFIYLNRSILNIKYNVETPFFILERLRRCDIKITNNILINIINYIFIEIGQVIKIYDLDVISKKIIIRYADNDTIKINNKKNKLHNNDIVITNGKKILSIGNSTVYCDNVKVSKFTKNIFVECSYFKSQIKSKNIIKYNSYNMYNSNVGIKYSMQKYALEYFTYLVMISCDGLTGPVNYLTNNYKKNTKKIICINKKKINNILGLKLSHKNIKKILLQLKFKNKFINDNWKIEIPFLRKDIQIEEDMVNEILRIYGCNNIPAIAPKIRNKKIKKDNNNYSFLKKAKDILVCKGYFEIITYSFVKNKFQKILYPKEKQIYIKNPISNKISNMRLSMFTGLLQTLIYNLKRNNITNRLFECGLCFSPDNNFKKNTNIKQELLLSGLLLSTIENDNLYDHANRKMDFFDLKSDIESILSIIDKLENFNFCSKESKHGFHPYKSASIFYKNKKIGFIGSLHPNITSLLNIKYDVILFELFIDKIIFNDKKNIYDLSKISYLPVNIRDISIIISDKIPVSKVVDLCYSSSKKYISDVKVFDVYMNDKINKNKKSVSINLILQPINKTFTEKKISIIINNCLFLLNKKLKATLRTQ
ncbi:phenylalanine--tRNA ligase subunit beta [Buchnera aphidicola (Taiwanaphis decaspermi)]|uniref:phenylalanine--tRNA ligase subunit beta n=1 Tax=Buchnera aphidicola TaxID=9 RepID=UPI0031B88666